MAEKIAEIPIEEIAKINAKERKQLEKYVKTLQSGYKRRVQAFERKNLVSHAQVSLEGSLTGAKQIPISKMTRNQLILEFARYSKFFNSVTSTERGIKEVNREQDKRIFGTDSRGRPRKTMSTDERREYWKTYDEFKNQNPTATSKYGSESIQQQVADALFTEGAVNDEDFVGTLNRIRESLVAKHKEQNLRSVPNVYSGRGNPFKK